MTELLVVVRSGLAPSAGAVRDQISPSTQIESTLRAEATMADSAAQTSNTDAEQVLVLDSELKPGQCVVPEFDYKCTDW